MIQGLSLFVCFWPICLPGHKRSSLWCRGVVSGLVWFLDWSLTHFQEYCEGWREPPSYLWLTVKFGAERLPVGTRSPTLFSPLFLWIPTGQHTLVVPCDRTYFPVLTCFVWWPRGYIHTGGPGPAQSKSKMCSIWAARASGEGGWWTGSSSLPGVMGCCRKGT